MKDKNIIKYIPNNSKQMMLCNCDNNNYNLWKYNGKIYAQCYNLECGECYELTIRKVKKNDYKNVQRTTNKNKQRKTKPTRKHIKNSTRNIRHTTKSKRTIRK